MCELGNMNLEMPVVVRVTTIGDICDSCNAKGGYGNAGLSDIFPRRGGLFEILPAFAFFLVLNVSHRCSIRPKLTFSIMIEPKT